MEEILKKHNIKIQIGTLSFIIVTVIVWTITISNIFAKIDIRFEQSEARLRHLEGKTDLYTERYAETIEAQQVLKVDMAKIQTKLSSIEALILDLKTDLKEHSK